jgi:hypothetical protein
LHGAQALLFAWNWQAKLHNTTFAIVVHLILKSPKREPSETTRSTELDHRVINTGVQRQVDDVRLEM